MASADRMGLFGRNHPWRWSSLPAVFLFPLVFTVEAWCAASQWYFVACGKQPLETVETFPPDFDLSRWTPVTFPHSFNHIQSQANVYGWYLCSVAVPESLKRRDLILDLGLIDDVDVTYFNGTEVGRMGNFAVQTSSAWNQDRRYKVPWWLVNCGARKNLVAVLTKNFTGIGGLLGQPYIGAVLPADWKCRFLAGDGPAEKMAASGLDDGTWTQIALPDVGWNRRVTKSPGFGWYRMRFDLPEELTGRDLPVDLGRIYDVAACYLNGTLVGQMGKFPPETFLQTAGRFRCMLPASLLKPKDNLLAVRLYNDSQFGGLVGIPTIPLGDYDLLGEFKTVQDLLDAMNRKWWPAKVAPEKLLTLCDYLIHSNQPETVAQLCQRVMADKQTRRELVPRAQCVRIYALWLAGQGDGAWSEFQRLDFSQPIPFDTATAMAAYGRTNKMSSRDILCIGRDTVTGGDWDLRYGSNDAILCAMASPFSYRYGGGSRLAYTLKTGSTAEHPRAWLGARETADKRALFLPATGKYCYASWDDRGEIRPFDDNGPDLLMDLPIPAGPHLLSLYLVDWDWYAGEHPRMETVLLHGEKMEPIVLSTGKFGGGYYERLLVKGPKKLSLRISKHRSPCVVVSGIFLDKVAPPQPVPQRGDTTAGVSIRAMPERPVELCLMANRFAVLTAAYERDPLGAIQSPEWAAFESDCAALAAKPNPSGHVLWWLAECQRVRADFAASQKSLVACLQRMSMEMPPDQRKKFLTGLARRMATFGYRPEASLAALQEAARTDPEDPRGRMEEFLRRYHGGGVFHAAAQWVKMNPLPTRIQDRDDER